MNDQYRGYELEVPLARLPFSYDFILFFSVSILIIDHPSTAQLYNTPLTRAPEPPLMYNNHRL